MPHAARTRAAPSAYVFCKQGEYWTVTYEGRVFRLRDAKGMTYLAHLLRRSGQRIPAAERVAARKRGLPAVDCGLEDADGCATHNLKSAKDERARLTVTQRIKAVLKKIHAHDPSLGHHLSTCIHTGHLCAYVPDPAQTIRWVL